MNKRSCATCSFKGLFMDAKGAIGSSICRRHPPVTHLILVPTPQGPQPLSSTQWPTVSEHDWCGEWQAENAVVTQ